MDSYAVEARDLRKVFTARNGFWGLSKKSTLAVDEISFCIGRGELFGLLGPNGAGKTTTVKMLSTLLLPTTGTVSILGFDAVRQTQEVRKRIGFTFGGAHGLYTRLNAVDNLRYFAELYDLEPAVTRKRIPELLDLVGLAGRGEDRVETFSSGMQQRLHLARVLLHDPELIFLDEPTVGIDPVGARELRRTVKSLVACGKTILLTTHYMAEAEELCDRIAIIQHGRLVAMDTPSMLKQRIRGEAMVEVRVREENLAILMDSFRALDGRASINILDEHPFKKVTVRTLVPGDVMQLLSPYMNPDFILGLEVRSQTLEDVYVAIIEAESK
jgi:ABC-type multidrug transport system ATPase subunit